MKTVEGFIQEIAKNDALKNELNAIADKAALADFLKANDVDATVDDFAEAVRKKAEDEGELNDADAQAVAGGTPQYRQQDAFTSGAPWESLDSDGFKRFKQATYDVFWRYYE